MLKRAGLAPGLTHPGSWAEGGPTIYLCHTIGSLEAKLTDIGGIQGVLGVADLAT